LSQLEQSLEIELRREARQRELLRMYDDKDWQGLLSAAELLNEQLSRQQAMNKWLVREAADSVGEAWELQRKLHRKADGSIR
jgi:hypothetical protein